jgi:hypothetical protein
MIPGEPKYLLDQLITDCTIGLGVTVADPVVLSTGCDRWDYNRIERPFNDTFKDYFPQSDIARAQVGFDEDWFFAQIITYSGEVVDPQPMNGTYGIELDYNLDGRGDYLILASMPSETWDVARVQVWGDPNVTVGAEVPVMADEDNPEGGYEEMIFDSGMGDDPDLAWARLSPDDPYTVQIAFKRILAGEKGQFSWIMWAGLIDFVPPDFDLVDTYTELDLYEFDNTCSWTYGVPLQGFPNECGVYVEEKEPGPGEVCVKPPEPVGAVGAVGAYCWDPNACKWGLCN